LQEAVPAVSAAKCFFTDEDEGVSKYEVVQIAVTECFSFLFSVEKMVNEKEIIVK